MVRLLGYCGPKVYKILHLPRISKATLVLINKKEGRRKPEGKEPCTGKSRTHRQFFAFESYLI